MGQSPYPELELQPVQLQVESQPQAGEVLELLELLAAQAGLFGPAQRVLVEAAAADDTVDTEHRGAAAEEVDKEAAWAGLRVGQGGWSEPEQMGLKWVDWIKTLQQMMQKKQPHGGVST